MCIEDEVVQIASSASESEEMVTSSCKPQRSDRVDCGQYWQPGSGTFPPEGHSVKMHDREVYLHCIPPYSEDIYRYLLTMEVGARDEGGDSLIGHQGVVFVVLPSYERYISLR